MKLLIFSLLLLFSCTLTAQVNNINDEDMNNLTRLGNNSSVRVPKVSYAKTFGSPFLERKWQIAKVKLKNLGDAEIIMKYDIYKDQILYYRDTFRDSLILNPGQVQEFTFKYLPYKTFRLFVDSLQFKQSGYYEMYHEGKFSLLKKWSVYFTQGGSSETYTTKDNGFIRKERWFVWSKEGFYKIRLNKASFFKLIDQHHEKIKNFGKQEKINYTSPEDWIKLLNFSIL